MTIEEINRKYGGYEGNILKKCSTKYIGDFYVPQSEPCEMWWDWESPVRNLISEYIRPNSIFLDAGANIGYFSLLAATIIKGGPIYAVEPNPFIFSVLQENIALHNLNNVSAYNYALSDRDSSEIEFHWRNGANGNGRSYDPTEHDKNQWMTYTVKTASLDLFADCKINIVKMDIEGAELDVLQNSDIFFERNKEVKIILELHKVYIEERVGTKGFDDFIAYLNKEFDVKRKGGGFIVLVSKRA